MEYKSNNNIVYSNKYHVVWCVKYRRKLLTDIVSKRLKQIVLGVAVERNADLLEIETDKDHIHLLVEVDPQYGIHKLVKQMKGRSSRELRLEFTDCRSRVPSLWTNSYFVSSVGGAPIAQIKKYIQDQ